MYFIQNKFESIKNTTQRKGESNTWKKEKKKEDPY